MCIRDSCGAQIEDRRRIKLSGEQSFLRLVEADGVAQVLFAELLFSSAIAQQIVLFGNRFDRERLALPVLNGVAGAKANAPERGVAACIFPLLSAGLEVHRY